MEVFFATIFGLVVGSFLNVAINRLRLNRSLGGRSRCPRCRRVLGPADLVPVLSFLWLGGRCRHCGKPISWQYPAVEGITAAVFGLLVWQGGINFSTAANLLFAAILILIAVYDFKHMLILDKVVFPSLGLAAFYAGLRSWQAGSLLSWEGAVVSGALGAAGLAGFFYLQYAASKGRWIGFGDVKLGLFLGMLLGWPLALAMLFMSYLTGAIIGVGLIAAGKKQLGSRLPFGTFLAAGALFAMLFGQAALDWYLGLILLR